MVKQIRDLFKVPAPPVLNTRVNNILVDTRVSLVSVFSFFDK